MSCYIDFWKRGFDFYGRSTRKQYWMTFLFNLLVAVILSILVTINGKFVILSGLYSLAALIPGLALFVRRLHDCGKPWPFILLGLIPFVGSIILFVFCCLPSDPGMNQWGPNPYYTEKEIEL